MAQVAHLALLPLGPSAELGVELSETAPRESLMGTLCCWVLTGWPQGLDPPFTGWAERGPL